MGTSKPSGLSGVWVLLSPVLFQVGMQILGTQASSPPDTHRVVTQPGQHQLVTKASRDLEN